MASLPWDFPHEGVLFLELAVGGGRGESRLVCPWLLAGVDCLQRLKP